jgi:hypothetical protein
VVKATPVAGDLRIHQARFSGIVDAIPPRTSEIPGHELAESIQRIPAVTIDRRIMKARA